MGFRPIFGVIVIYGHCVDTLWYIPRQGSEANGVRAVGEVRKVAQRVGEHNTDIGCCISA